VVDGDAGDRGEAVQCGAWLSGTEFVGGQNMRSNCAAAPPPTEAENVGVPDPGDGAKPLSAREEIENGDDSRSHGG
jgi:hypothetical protein